MSASPTGNTCISLMKCRQYLTLARNLISGRYTHAKFKILDSFPQATQMRQQLMLVSYQTNWEIYCHLKTYMEASQ